MKRRDVKDSYIAAKERWARKMAGQKTTGTRSAERLPPGQRQVHNFPVLDLGLRPAVPLDKWELKIHGHVENPVTLNWQQFLALPQFKDVSDFHCVTTWSQFDMEWEGVAFFTIAELVEKLAVPVPNEHTDRVQAKAKEHGIYVQTGTMIESDPKWPPPPKMQMSGSASRAAVIAEGPPPDKIRHAEGLLRVMPARCLGPP